LDPFASGLLVIGIGRGTKELGKYVTGDKVYWTKLRFGVTSATFDREGEPTPVASPDGLTRARVEAALATFRGEILQRPPSFSAVKLAGVPAYKLARKGSAVEPEARKVFVKRLELLGFTQGANAEAELLIHCGKGFYVRGLARDLGISLGVGAICTELRRLQVADLDVSDAIPAAPLMEPSSLLSHLRRVSMHTISRPVRRVGAERV
jgi:tRNA pseudouridine55 synthase